MLRSIKNKLVILIAMLTLAVPTFIPLTASASSISTNICRGTNFATGTDSTDCGKQSITTGISSLAKKVVDIFSVIVGVVSVIMIIYAGFRYVTSGGESSNVSGAKNTLIYAIIGLVIVVLAQLIVHYVLNTATGIGTNSSF